MSNLVQRIRADILSAEPWDPRIWSEALAQQPAQITLLVWFCFDAEKSLGLIFIPFKEYEILNVKVPQGGMRVPRKGSQGAGDSARSLP